MTIKENPDIMYVQMGEETDSTYQVVFRSYTGAFVNFYVDKATGTTRMEEYGMARDSPLTSMMAVNKPAMSEEPVWVKAARNK